MKLSTIAVAALACAAPVFGRDLLQAAPAPAPSSSAALITDADIVNFALNLEYLEANFYHCAVFGTPIPANLSGTNPGTLTGCQQANLTDVTLSIAQELARDELNHVAYLRSALGSAAVDQPAINIGSAFGAAADAAVNGTLSPPFSPYANDLFFLHGAFIFEDVGVTAYKGAAPSITSPAILSAAAGILATEAYHAGAVRTLLIENYDVVTPYGLNVTTIIDRIATLRNTVSAVGTGTVDGGITTTASSDQIVLVPADGNSIAYSRTPAQVLAIVYLGSASQPGGFFPNGVNGKIR
jgi:hypothetical protein